MLKITAFLMSMFVAGFLSAAANPAYSYCVNSGGTIETRVDQKGNQWGICKFDLDGQKSECGQWRFFRGECSPGDCLTWSVETQKCEEAL